MKKRAIVLVCALTLMFGNVMNVSAEVSPTGKKDTTETTDKDKTAPKTGEGNLFIYGIAAALLCSGAVVISRKRLEETK